jgi:hypothetical protein
MTITIKLTREQAKELASLLWECCTETDDGIKYLRDDLPLAAIWRTVVESLTPQRPESCAIWEPDTLEPEIMINSGDCDCGRI